MATATPSQRSVPNGAALPTINGAAPAPRSRDWTRNGEPGSAFRGLSKGRGGPERGGRGSGRGPRGGRGIGGIRGGRVQAERSNDNGGKVEEVPAKAESSTADKGAAARGAPPPSSAAKSAVPSSNDRASKPKPPSRRASRSIPSLIIAPSSPTTAVPVHNNSTTTARPSNRRRRSQQQKPTPTSATSTQSLSVETSSSHLRLPLKARTGPPSPVPSGPSKDAPPHLSAAPEVTTFDMKHNIDALVERVRAVANRPTTPGSHLDWAGDDDESLPDLDDWGVNTGTSTGDKEDMISPILEDSLKPLPDLGEQTGAQSLGSESITRSPSVSESNNGDKPLASDPINRPPAQNTDSSPAKSSHLSYVSETNDTYKGQHTHEESEVFTSKETSKAASAGPVAPNHHVEVAKSALHPSLPPKPVGVVDMPRGRKGPGATPMRNPTPPAPVPSKSVVASVEPPLVKVEGEEGLAQSMHVPAPAGGSQESPAVEKFIDGDVDGEQGLAASIHAPKESVPKSSSAPSHISSHIIPTHPHAFNPTHGRAHTLGRPHSFGSPTSVPGNNSLGHRFSRYGANTPRGSLAPHGAYHARNHSSPPTGPSLMGHRAPHATRPIITGDAISRLARTIGGTSISSRSAGVVTKE